MRVDRLAVMVASSMIVRMGVDERRNQGGHRDRQRERNGNSLPHGSPIVGEVGAAVKAAESPLLGLEILRFKNPNLGRFSTAGPELEAEICASVSRRATTLKPEYAEMLQALDVQGSAFRRATTRIGMAS